MFLDLASTIVGGVLVLVGEGVLLVVVMIWALMDTGKRADEQGEMRDACPLKFDSECSECWKYAECEAMERAKNREWEA